MGKYRLHTCKNGTRALFASTRSVPPSANMADTLSGFPVPPSENGCCCCVCNILSRFSYVLITLLEAASLSRAHCTRTVRYGRRGSSGVPAAANVLLIPNFTVSGPHSIVFTSPTHPLITVLLFYDTRFSYTFTSIPLYCYNVLSLSISTRSSFSTYSIYVIVDIRVCNPAAVNPPNASLQPSSRQVRQAPTPFINLRHMVRNPAAVNPPTSSLQPSRWLERQAPTLFIHLRHIPLLPSCIRTLHAIPIRSHPYHLRAKTY
jgi:hypothetical protein